MIAIVLSLQYHDPDPTGLCFDESLRSDKGTPKWKWRAQSCRKCLLILLICNFMAILEVWRFNESIMDNVIVILELYTDYYWRWLGMLIKLQILVTHVHRQQFWNWISYLSVEKSNNNDMTPSSLTFFHYGDTFIDEDGHQEEIGRGDISLETMDFLPRTFKITALAHESWHRDVCMWS